MRGEPQVIQLSEAAIPVVEANCRRCHENVVGQVHLMSHEEGSPRCWDCHRETPHGRGRSLSATPGVMRPQLPEIKFGDQTPQIGGRAPRPETPTSR